MIRSYRAELEVLPSVFALLLYSSLSLCCWPLSARGYWASTAQGTRVWFPWKS